MKNLLLFILVSLNVVRGISQNNNLKIGGEISPSITFLKLGQIQNAKFKSRNQIASPRFGFYSRLLVTKSITDKLSISSGLHFGYNNMKHDIEHYFIPITEENLRLYSEITYLEVGIPIILSYKLLKNFEIDFNPTLVFIPKPSVDAHFSQGFELTSTDPVFRREIIGEGAQQDISTKNVSVGMTLKYIPDINIGKVLNKFSIGVGYRSYLFLDKLYFTESDARRSSITLNIGYKI